jgi:hypothetical protein
VVSRQHVASFERDDHLRGLAALSFEDVAQVRDVDAKSGLFPAGPISWPKRLDDPVAADCRPEIERKERKKGATLGTCQLDHDLLPSDRGRSEQCHFHTGLRCRWLKATRGTYTVPAASRHATWVCGQR